MLKIAMLGADSSHVDAYAALMNPPDAPFHGRAQVIALWGAEADQAAQKAAALNIPRIAATPDEALKGVDLVMVEARYGDDHAALTRLALERGLPVFVDKPITNSLDDARDLFGLAQLRGAALFSCSPLRYAAELAALPDALPHTGAVMGLAAYPSLGPRAANIYFYGVHLAELLLTVFGGGVEAARWMPGVRADVGTVRYADGRLVTLHFLRETREVYHVTLTTEQAVIAADIDAWGDFYPRTLGHILSFGETHQAPVPPAETLEIMRVLDAFARAAGEKSEAWHTLR